MDNGVILKGLRVVVPQPLNGEYVQQLHKGNLLTVQKLFLHLLLLPLFVNNFDSLLLHNKWPYMITKLTPKNIQKITIKCSQHSWGWSVTKIKVQRSEICSLMFDVHETTTITYLDVIILWHDSKCSVSNKQMKAKLTKRLNDYAENLNHMFYQTISPLKSSLIGHWYFQWNHVEQVFPEEQFSRCPQIAPKFLQIWQRYLCRDVVLLLLQSAEQTRRTFIFQDDNVSNRNWCLGFPETC